MNQRVVQRVNVHTISQYKTAKNGSTLLFVVLITGCLITIVISCWHAGALRQDLITDRMRYEQRFRITQGALNYGIAYAQSCFDELLKTYEKSIDLNEYAQLLDDKYAAQVIFFSQKQSVLIKA